MMNFPPIKVMILPTEDIDGFLLRYECVEKSIAVTFPHPAESICLTRNNEQIPREFFPFEWDNLAPRKLETGEVLFALIRLSPYWTNLDEEVIVKCIISWQLAGASEWSELQIQGRIRLKLPSYDEIIHRKDYSIAEVSPKMRPQVEIIQENNGTE